MLKTLSCTRRLNKRSTGVHYPYIKYNYSSKEYDHVIGYKSAGDGKFIVKLQILKSIRHDLYRHVNNKKYAHYRSNEAIVLDIMPKSLFKTTVNKNKTIDDKKVTMVRSDFKQVFKYKIGEFVKADMFGMDIRSANSHGIHFYLSEEPAYYYNLDRTNYTGLYKVWHHNGTLFKEYNYVKGKIRGIYKEYYSNGNVFLICNYENGRLNGPYEQYYDNEQLHLKYNIKKVKKYKIYEEYHDKHHILNGKKDGLYEEFHNNGQIKIKYCVKNGKKNGSYEEFYDNSQIKIKCNYDNGKKYGLYEEFYINGKLKKKFNVKEILKSGYISHLKYIECTQTRYNYFTNQIIIGEYLEYHENGHLKMRYNINENRNMHGIYEEYYENGRLKIKYGIENGLKHGDYEVRYDNGELMNKCTYEYNGIQGTVYSWHPNGKKCQELRFNDDILIYGSIKEWNENEEILKSGNYVPTFPWSL